MRFRVCLINVITSGQELDSQNGKRANCDKKETNNTEILVKNGRKTGDKQFLPLMDRNTYWRLLKDHVVENKLKVSWIFNSDSSCNFITKVLSLFVSISVTIIPSKKQKLGRFYLRRPARFAR